MIPTTVSRINKGGRWLVEQISPIGLWLIVFCSVFNLIVNAISIQTSHDVIANEQQIAEKTNAFLERIEQEEQKRLSGDSAFIKEFREAMATIQKEEHERLSGDSEYMKEFRKTTRDRDEMLDRIYNFLSEKFGYLPPSPQ